MSSEAPRELVVSRMMRLWKVFHNWTTWLGTWMRSLKLQSFGERHLSLVCFRIALFVEEALQHRFQYHP